jgi:hypothetical protein
LPMAYRKKPVRKHGPYRMGGCNGQSITRD